MLNYVPDSFIRPGTARGFIAEENYFIKVNTGIRQDGLTIDSIFWNNEFNAVACAIHASHDLTSPPVGRIIVIDNTINLARTTATGIQIVGDGTQRNFTDVVIRKNIIAADPVTSGATTALSGIKVFNAVNAIVENNIVCDCENGAAGPIEYSQCDTLKSFNNQNRSGSLLRAYDATSSRHLMELQDLTEDSLMSF